MSEPRYMKPREYAEASGIPYRTVIKYYNEGILKGRKLPTGRIMIQNDLTPEPNHHTPTPQDTTRVILYARVSSANNKKSLDGQLERLRDYAAAKGWTIIGEYKEIASGLNDHRRILDKILRKSKEEYDVLLVEHKDRLTRFGWHYIQLLEEKQGITIQAVNQSEEKNNEIIDDFISIITSFCMRIYGSNRKAKTQKIIQEIQEEIN